MEPEDFDYRNIVALKNYWTYNETDFEKGNSIAVSAGELTLANDGSWGWSFVVRDWKTPEVYDWKYSAMAKLVGPDSYNLMLVVTIQNSSGLTEYVFSLEGNSYILRRNYPVGEILNSTPGYAATHDKWFTFALERCGSTFKMYHDGSLKRQVDVENLGRLVRFGIGAGYNSTTKFEWLTMEYNEGMHQDKYVWPYLFWDGGTFAYCFAVAYLAGFRFKAANRSNTYFAISFVLFWAGVVTFLLFINKFGWMDFKGTTVIVSGIVGLISAVYMHVFTKSPQKKLPQKQQATKSA